MEARRMRGPLDRLRDSCRSISLRFFSSEMVSNACCTARNRELVCGFLSGWYLVTRAWQRPETLSDTVRCQRNHASTTSKRHALQDQLPIRLLCDVDLHILRHAERHVWVK